MGNLTIVMYHYVRPIANSDFPGIKGLELQGFKRQLDFLEENYSIVGTEQVIDAVLTSKRLPPDACWLTFDDGYKDHFRYVLPELLKRDLSGAFFPPRVAIENNSMLDVNSIHHILSCANDIKQLVNELNKSCVSLGFSDDLLKSLYNQFGVPNRWDTADVIYFKRMLQHALPLKMRNSITESLFKKYVGVTESEFSRELYMDMEEVRQLVTNGMYVGSHGSMHHWLDKVSVEEQRQDVKDSLEFLDNVGAPTEGWVMCYPWGAYNTATLSLMREFNAAVGVTTEVRMANISNDNPLTLPRFNTNDFPQ